MWPRSNSVLALAAILPFAAHVAASDSLDYLNRGNWSEGIKSAPVSGYGLVLVGAAAIPQSDCRMKGVGNLTLSLRTKITGRLFPAVREQVPVYNYWLDEVQPAAIKPGATQGEQVFKWPISTVLARLQQMDLSNLISITRVGSASPSSQDRVAMGMICSEGVVAGPLNGYLFQFGTRMDSRVSALVAKETGEIVWRLEHKQSAAIPVRVFWKPGALPKGRYSLQLSTKSEHSDAQIEYRVLFDHLW